MSLLPPLLRLIDSSKHRQLLASPSLLLSLLSPSNLPLLPHFLESLWPAIHSAVTFGLEAEARVTMEMLLVFLKKIIASGSAAVSQSQAWMMLQESIEKMGRVSPQGCHMISFLFIYL